MNITAPYRSSIGRSLAGGCLPLAILASGLLAALVPPAYAAAAAAPSAPLAAEPYEYDPGGRRDPFRSLISSVICPLPRFDLCPPLQDFPLASLTLVGVVRGVSGAKGLVTAPNGRSYVIMQAMRVGPHCARVVRIESQALILEAVRRDAYGTVVTETTVLRLVAHNR